MPSGEGPWIEKFDKRQTPQGRDYYWLAGEFVNQDKGRNRRMGSWKRIL
jgi:hypothetical protein